MRLGREIPPSTLTVHPGARDQQVPLAVLGLILALSLALRVVAHPRRPAYYLRSNGTGDTLETIGAYRDAGFRWAVVSRIAVDNAKARARTGDSTGIRYYRALEREAAQVAEFRPERWHRMGPVIRVYRLGPAGGTP